MTLLAARDLSRVREVAANLGVLTDGAPPALATLMPELRGLLDVDLAVAYGVAQQRDRLRVEFTYGTGFRPEPFNDYFERSDGYLVGGSAYNPARPDPRHRNVVQAIDEVPGVQGTDVRSTKLFADVLPQCGVRKNDQLRVLVCDGPSLLAWVGGFQDDAFRPRQRALLARLIPPLRQRLILERTLSAAPLWRAALDSALEAIPAAAFVVTRTGSVVHANVAGRAILEQDGCNLRASLVAATVDRPTSHALQLTRIVARGVPIHFLAVLCRPTDETDHRVRRAAHRWELTPRQAEVLRQVVEGRSNRTIAAILGIAEATVELHVSALLEKAQCESRSQLVARVLA